MTQPDLNIALNGSLLSHLVNGGDTALEEHIRSGGTFATYVAKWTADRDERARARAITPETAAQILDLPAEREGEGSSVREYLIALLKALWLDAATPKYGMHGSSDWRYDLYEALLKAGLIGAWADGWGIGYRPGGGKHPEDQERADRLITAAIDALSSRSAAEA